MSDLTQKLFNEINRENMTCESQIPTQPTKPIEQKTSDTVVNIVTKQNDLLFFIEDLKKNNSNKSFQELHMDKDLINKLKEFNSKMELNDGYTQSQLYLIYDSIEEIGNPNLLKIMFSYFPKLMVPAGIARSVIMDRCN